MKVFAALCLASAAVAVKLPSYYSKGSEGGSSGELAQKGPGSGPTSSEVYAYLSAKWDACVDAYGEDECVARAEAYAPPSGELAQKKGPTSSEVYAYLSAKWDACVDAYGEDECVARAEAYAPPSGEFAQKGSYELPSDLPSDLPSGLELAQKGPGSGPTSSEVYAYLSAKWDACVDAYGEDECVARAE